MSAYKSYQRALKTPGVELQQLLRVLLKIRNLFVNHNISINKVVPLIILGDLETSVETLTGNSAASSRTEVKSKKLICTRFTHEP